jgi:hypothetical protein
VTFARVNHWSGVPAIATQSVSAPRYHRRDPESIVFYQIVREHLATFFAPRTACPGLGRAAQK